MYVLKRCFFAVLMACVLVIASPTSHIFAQTSGSSNYHFNSGGLDFGNLGGFSAGQSGSVENILEVGVNLGGGADFLGCAGVDLFGFIETTFNFNFNVDRFVNNLKTKVAKWALTQMMATPQIAAVFDTLNQMENFRWDMFNESCNLNEIKSAATDKFVEYCAKQPGMDAIQCREKYDEQSTGYLKKAADKFLNFDKMFGTMMDVLPGTSFCKGKDGAKNGMTCGLSAFLPHMRFCHSSDTGGAGCTHVGEIQIGDTFLGFPIILDTAVKVFGEEVYGGKAGAGRPLVIEEMLNSGMSLDEVGLTLRKLENAAAPEPTDTSSFGDLAQEYIQWAGCQYLDPFVMQKKLADVAGVSVSSYPDFGQFSQQIMAQLNDQGLEDAFSKLGTKSANEVKEVVATAMACVVNHDVDLGIYTDYQLLRYPRSTREEFYKAAALEAGQVMINKLISFIEQKVETSEAEISVDTEEKAIYASGGCGKDGEKPLNYKQQQQWDERGDTLPAPCEDMTHEKPEFIKDAFKILKTHLRTQKAQMKIDRRINQTFLDLWKRVEGR